MSMSIKRSRLFKLLAVAALAMVMAIGTAPVSYTHLDVYKRQPFGLIAQLVRALG